MRSLSIEDMANQQPMEVETTEADGTENADAEKSAESDHNESDDLASADENDPEKSSESTSSEESAIETDESDRSGSQESNDEKALSGGEVEESKNDSDKKMEASDWSISKQGSGDPKVAQTDQNQTSQNGSNAQGQSAPTPSGGADQPDQIMVDTGFAGFSIADLTFKGEAPQPEVLASFKTSMYWLNRRLGKR